jgi:hypothetical protein
MKKLFIATTMVLAAISAQATTFTVDAKNNSSTGGLGLDTITLSAGQSFSVLASELDLWNAGALPRFSNANGLIGNVFATGSDESGQAVGTLISKSFGNYTQNGFTAAYGQLVGQVGSQYFALGTNTTATTTSAGTLKLFYWDSNASDNTGSIAVSITSVPEPETYAMLLAGLGLMGAVARRRKNKQA